MRTTYRVGLLLLTAVLLASCADGPIGLFESIERERKIIDDRGLDNNITVGAMAKASSRYFIAAGSLWYRNDTDADYPNTVSEWVRITPPGAESDNYVTQSVVAFDPGVGTGREKIYAVFTDQSGTKAGVYVIDPSVATPIVSGPVFGTSHVNVTGLLQLFVVNDGTEDYLLVVARDNQAIPQYLVYESNNAANEAAFAALAALLGNAPVIDIDEDGSNGVAYVTRHALFTGTITDPDVNDDAAENGPFSTATGTRTPLLGGLFYDGLLMWVGDNEGYLYSSTDSGGTWTVAPSAHPISSANTDPIPFTDFAIADGTVVVGTDGYGYRELGADATIAPKPPDLELSNYQASELARSAVLMFFVNVGVNAPVPQGDGTFVTELGDLLFAGTSNVGLWKALYYGEPPQWLRE